jgi:multiple sugar transport system substrate-binding protein
MTVRTHRARGRRGGPSPYPTRAARGWRSFGAAFVVLVFVPPLLLLVGGSLRQPGLPPPPRPELIPDPISTEGYATALNLGGLLRASVNSLVVVAIAVPVSVLVAALAGFALTRVSRRLVGAVAAASCADIVDDPQHPTRFTLDAPATREALKNLVDLRLAYGVVPSDEEVEAEDEESRFVNGRVAMVISSRRVTTTFRTITGFDWDVAKLPTYGRPSNILHSDAYCIPAGSKNKDAAWRFVEYAMSAEGQRIIAATGRTVPSNIEISKSEAFLDPTKPPLNAKVWLDAIPNLRRVPTVSTWPEIEDATNGILENAMYRGDRLDHVIRQIDEQTRPLFARAEAP